MDGDYHGQLTRLSPACQEHLREDRQLQGGEGAGWQRQGPRPAHQDCGHDYEDEHDGNDGSADDIDNLTRTRRRGLLLAAATQASRESRRPMQQPGGGGISHQS